MNVSRGMQAFLRRPSDETERATIRKALIAEELEPYLRPPASNEPFPEASARFRTALLQQRSDVEALLDVVFHIEELNDSILYFLGAGWPQRIQGTPAEVRINSLMRVRRQIQMRSQLETEAMQLWDNLGISNTK